MGRRSSGDRSSGQLARLNSENGGVSDAKIRVVKLVLLGDSGVGRSVVLFFALFVVSLTQLPRIMEGEKKVCPICRRLIHKLRRLFHS
ncbi:hypothetical protein ACB092_08G154600 [Castanea dentata]